MRTVEDESGRRYLLEKRLADSSRVRDVATGERRHVDNDRLSPLDESPLKTATSAVPEHVQRLLLAVPSERALGLLIELSARGPLSVAALLDAYDLCESDLNGLLTHFQLADIVAEVAVDGQRGYALTDQAHDAIEILQSAGTD